jgi:uncharacterized protein YkwD
MLVPLAPPERAIVQAVNVERTARGLSPVRTFRGLSRAAESHSWDQLRYDRFGHDSADGTPFGRRIARVGRFRMSAEVVAFAPRGSGSGARSIVRLWMRSSGHRAQVLNPNFRILGVGRVRGRLQGQLGTMVTADLAVR